MKSTQKLLLPLICAAALMGNEAQAGLQIPYAPDGNTIHLWHFDGVYTNLDGTTNLFTPDAVATGGMTLTNTAQTQVPGSIITLGNPSLTGLTNCLHIIATNLTTGNTYAYAYGGTNTTVSFQNPTTAAFTYEAIVKLDANPFANPSTVNFEIICGDGSINGNANRGWQFRISCGPSPTINFNAFPGNNAAVNNLSVALPSSGANAVAVGQWYHVAVTYTGSAPTNGDTTGIFTFYWTLLDANRTNADVLGSPITVGSGFGLAAAGMTPLGVGGNGRANNGIANNEGFKGYIDEARMSIVARKANEMVFTTGGTLNPPTVLQQPPTNTFVGYGKPINLSTLISGTPPLYTQWQQDSGTGYTNVTSQTNSSFAASATFGMAGNYRLVITNNYGSKTSLVAQVSVGAAFSEIFNSGVDATGVPVAVSGLNDLHYTLVQSADINHLGPAVIDWDMLAQPMLSAGGRFANADGISGWVGPELGSTFYTSPIGVYVYRTTFLIDSADLTMPATLQGSWVVNSGGVDILLNGHSTGIVNLIPRVNQVAFVITNGLVAGLNTMDFVTTNAQTVDFESAVRVILSGLGQALPAGIPTIAAQPADQSVRDNQNGAGSEAKFSVVALGRPPLSYQWWADSAPVTGATNRTLTFTSPDSTASPGTNFTVVISNDSGSITSQVAVLTLTTNHPPVVANYNLTIYSNTTVNFDLDQAYSAATDADGDPLTLSAYDTTTTNSVALTQAGTVLTFAPPADYVGADQFSYTISDGLASSQGFVDIHVLPLAAPSVVAASKSGNNFILSGSGGSAGGSFHVLSTTDLLTPLASWTTLSAGVFDGGGNLNVTNAITPGVPQSFYIIAVP